MDENAKDNRINDSNNSKNNSDSKVFIRILVISLLITFAFNVFSVVMTARSQSELEYSKFIKLVQEGKVESVEFQSDKLIVKPYKDKLEDGDQKLVNGATVFYTGRVGDDELVKLLKEKNVEFYAPIQYNSPIISFALSWILPLLIMYLGFTFIMRLMAKHMGGGLGGFGKSNAKVYMEKTTGVTFADVAGQDEAKESLQEIIDFLHNPTKYNKIGAKQPKGALLVGPPGTGKTLLAKAVAGEAKVPFFSLSGSDFVELYVGVGASRVRDLFKQAEENAPCIIFIDEIDSIGKSRDSKYGGGNDEREQTLNALLAEMDGFDSSKGILILAATNRPEVLDPALLRPGRFDRRVIVDTPDLQGRLETLKVHSKDVKMDETVNLEEIALATSGAVGSDLANMINEAAINAVKAGRKAISQADLFEAVEVVIAGKEKKNKILGAEEKKIVAYHEVGHALVTAIEKDAEPVQKITIVPRTMGSLGYVMTVPEEEKYLMSQSELEARLVMLLAGRAAEEIVFDSVTTGASNDMEKATKIAKSMIAMYGMSEKFGLMSLEQVENQYLGRSTSLNCSEKTASQIEEEIKILLKEKYEEAKRILTENRDKLDKIAEYLYEKETITGKQFMEIYHQCQAQEAGQQDAGETVEQQNDDNADSQVTDDNQ